MGIRFAITLSIVLLAYGGLGAHLYSLQLLKGEHYVAQAESQYLRALGASKRGNIYFTDKNGLALAAAVSKDVPLVYAVPKEIEDPLETANALSSILQMPANEIVQKIKAQGSLYALVAKKISSDVAYTVNELQLKGIYTGDAPSRFYPSQFLASQVLGFVGMDAKSAGEEGRYGVEKMYNELLTAKEGAQEGENVTLTIDPSIQTEAERILKDLIGKYGAKGGSVIVAEPKTGKILAMGNAPSFDPNAYGDFPLSSFMNQTVEGTYEPGSVFKVITMASALDAKKITPQTTFYDSGVLMVSGKKIQNWDLKGHGTVTMTNVIEESLNTGAAFAERQLGNEAFRKYLGQFGFGEKTGINLPGEVRGDLRRLTPNAPAIAYATASFGQGVAATPLQLIAAVSAIANGGTLMQPYLDAALEPKAIRRVIGEEAARQTTEMMVSAVDKAVVAKINGYSIAGKTGTAQVPDPVHGGYAEGKVINTYIGFGPTSDPKFIILFKLIEPEGAPLAGLTVVPAFRELAQFILNYYNIPPDRVNN